MGKNNAGQQRLVQFDDRVVFVEEGDQPPLAPDQPLQPEQIIGAEVDEGAVVTAGDAGQEPVAVAVGLAAGVGRDQFEIHSVLPARLLESGAVSFQNDRGDDSADSPCAGIPEQKNRLLHRPAAVGHNERQPLVPAEFDDRKLFAHALPVDLRVGGEGVELEDDPVHLPLLEAQERFEFLRLREMGRGDQQMVAAFGRQRHDFGGEVGLPDDFKIRDDKADAAGPAAAERFGDVVRPVIALPRRRPDPVPRLFGERPGDGVPVQAQRHGCRRHPGDSGNGFQSWTHAEILSNAI